MTILFLLFVAVLTLVILYFTKDPAETDSDSINNFRKFQEKLGENRRFRKGGK